MAEKTPISKNTYIPLNRVKTIMKTTPNVMTLSQESVFAMTKAAELFMVHLAQRALENSSGSVLDYNSLSQVVNSNEPFEFLEEIIPNKITGREYMEIMSKLQQQSAASSSATASSSEKTDT